MNEDYEYTNEMSPESFASWDCPKCDDKGESGEIDNEDGITQLGFEPFNGTTVECGKCKQEYNLSMRIVVESL